MSLFDTIRGLLARRANTRAKKSGRTAKAKVPPTPAKERKPTVPRPAAAPSPQTEPRVDDYHFEWEERGPEERPSSNSAAPQEVRPTRQPETVSPPSGTADTTQRKPPSETKRSAEPAKNSVRLHRPEVSTAAGENRMRWHSVTLDSELRLVRMTRLQRCSIWCSQMACRETSTRRTSIGSSEQTASYDLRFGQQSAQGALGHFPKVRQLPQSAHGE